MPLSQKNRVTMDAVFPFYYSELTLFGIHLDKWSFINHDHAFTAPSDWPWGFFHLRCLNLAHFLWIG